MVIKPFKDNNGVSLVELIVVIAIMAIMTGVMSLGLSILFSKDAESAAIVVDDALSRTRTMSMSKPGEFTLTIHCDKDGNYQGASANYITIANDIAEGTAGHVSEKIYFTTKAYIAKDSDTFPLSGDSDIVIVFDKANGSVKSIDGVAISSAKKVLINCCAVKNTTKKSVVSLMTVSGKHFVE